MEGDISRLRAAVKTRKATNYDILPPTDKKLRRTRVEWEGAEDKVVKLRAQGWSYNRIAEWLNENHPGKGTNWQKHTVMRYFQLKRERVRQVAMADSTVVEEATKAAIDTTRNLQTVNKKLWDLLEELENHKFDKIRCSACGETIEFEDPLKRIKAMHALMRTIEIADKLQRSLPVDKASDKFTSTLSVKEVIDSLVKEGVIVVVDKEKLTALEIPA